MVSQVSAQNQVAILGDKTLIVIRFPPPPPLWPLPANGVVLVGVDNEDAAVLAEVDDDDDEEEEDVALDLLTLNVCRMVAWPLLAPPPPPPMVDSFCLFCILTI